MVFDLRNEVYSYHLEMEKTFEWKNVEEAFRVLDTECWDV